MNGGQECTLSASSFMLFVHAALITLSSLFTCKVTDEIVVIMSSYAERYFGRNYEVMVILAYKSTMKYHCPKELNGQ